jgi:tetratricopeptide (TPR) repeat protein
MQPKVFLSYSWKNKDVADIIDKDWEAVGISLTRDVRGLKFKQDIKHFMRSVKQSDRVILLISEAYLQSQNCMYEALEMLNDERFKEKILPILVGDTKIHDPISRAKYIKYWEQKADELNESIKLLSDLDGTAGLQRDLSHYRRIRQSIDRFTTEIQDMLCASWPATKANNYTELYEHIGFDPAESTVLEHCNRALNLLSPEAQDVELEELSLIYPGNPHVLFARVKAAYAEKQFGKAKYLLDRLIKLKEDFWQAHYYLGVLFYIYSTASDRLVIAQKHFKRALELNARAEAVHVEYGNLLVERKEIDEAYYHYKEALAIDPNYTIGLYNYALLLQNKLPNPKEARPFYERLLYLAPEYPAAHANYGRLLANHYDEYDKAHKHLLHALCYLGNDASLNMSMAELLAKRLNKPKEAAHYYKIANNLDSSLKLSSQISFWI